MRFIWRIKTEKIRLRLEKIYHCLVKIMLRMSSPAKFKVSMILCGRLDYFAFWLPSESGWRPTSSTLSQISKPIKFNLHLLCYCGSLANAFWLLLARKIQNYLWLLGMVFASWLSQLLSWGCRQKSKPQLTWYSYLFYMQWRAWEHYSVARSIWW